MIKPPPRADVSIRLDQFRLHFEHRFHPHVTALWGPSGSGKTTVVRILAGLLKPDEGNISVGEQIWFDSKSDTCLKPEARGVGLVPQNALLFPHLNVLENVTFGSNDLAKSRVSEVLSALELDALTARATTNLSGGERQRVAVARALCCNPRLLLVDEPLSALDVDTRFRLLQRIKQLRNEADVPMIWVSHDALEIQTISDEVVFMQCGETRASGRPIDVLMDANVFPQTETSYENLLPCQIHGTRDHDTIVKLGQSGEGPSLIVTSLKPYAPGNALVGVAAGAILLSRTEATQTSAQNVIAGRVNEIRPIGGVVLVSIGIPDTVDSLVAEISHSAMQRFGLESGESVYLMFKSSACRIYPS